MRCINLRWTKYDVTDGQGAKCTAPATGLSIDLNECLEVGEEGTTSIYKKKIK